MSRTFFAVFVAITALAGCASNSYDVGRGDAVPVNELGSRGAQFAGQATQFHQANMAIDLCPQGTTEKVGGGSVNSGAGDKNGFVTYNVTTQSVARTKCDFGAMNPVPQVKATKDVRTPPAAQTGFEATRDMVAKPNVLNGDASAKATANVKKP